MVLFFGNVSSYKQDSIWSWFICFCYAICMILTYGLAVSLGVLFPVFMDSFSESRERTAWTTSIVIGVFCFASPTIGAFINKFGVRISTILGCLMCSAGLAMGSFVPTIVTLFIAFSLPFALGLGLVFLTSPIIATHYFNKRRSIALGFLMAGEGLGTMAFGPGVQALVEVFDWRNTFRVIAGLVALASVTGCFLHRGTSHPNQNDEATSKKFELNLALLKNPILLILMLTRGAYSSSRMTPYVHLIKYSDDLGIPGHKSSTLFMFIGIFATLARLGGGFLCNLKWIKTRLLFQASAFIMGVSTMLLTLAKTYGALVAYSIVFGLTDGMMMVTFLIECINSVEESKQTSAIGFTLLSAGVFALGSPPLSGFLADHFGNYIPAFLLAGAVGIISSLVPFLLLCVKRRSEDIIDLDIEEAEGLKKSENVRNRNLQLPQQSGEDELELTSNNNLVHNAHQSPEYSLTVIESSI